MTTYYSVTRPGYGKDGDFSSTYPASTRMSRRRLNTRDCGGCCCYYCRRTMHAPGTNAAYLDPERMATNDHYVPLSVTLGCGMPESRFVAACARCNGIKGSMPPEVFEYFVRQTDMSRGRAQLANEFRRFTYILIATGFHVAMREAADDKGGDWTLGSDDPEDIGTRRFETLH